MITDPKRMFAYGKTKFKRCGCPAMQANYDPRHNAAAEEMAAHYDRALLPEYKDPYGRVPESEARDAWLKAMDEVDDPDARKVGREVAFTLGWIKEVDNE